MSGEDVRLWGTPSESIRPERVLKDIGASGVRKVREAIRTYSDPSLAYQKVAANYQPEKLWEANLSFFKVRSVLGAGSFGTVFRGYNEKEKSKCAIKLVRTYKRDIDMIKREIRALGTLHHPNIVHLYCACITNDGVLTLIMPALYPLGKIVMEILAEQKEDRETKEVFQIFSEDVVHNIIQQVCCGLAFMHSHKFVHRDLKADNFLFDKEGTIKIADFGLSRKYTPAENSLGLLKTPCGTKLFMAPEVAKRYFDRSAAAYDIRAETWAVGICTLELLYGTIPFERNPNPDVEEEIAALQKMNTVRDVNWNRMYANGEQLRKKLSKHCKDFIDSCLKLNPADRPTVSELFVQKFWMLQPPIPNAELFEKLLGTCGEDNLKYLLEKKHRRKLEEHRRMNNNPANPIKLLKDLIMCISLSLGSSQERFFKKFVVKTSFHEKEAESLFHEMLFGYLYDEQINLYDFIYISTGAIKAFRRVKELDAKVKRGSRVREDESKVAAAEKPEVVDLQDGGKCVISWHKELFLDNASPTGNGERPEAPPRQRRISRNR